MKHISVDTLKDLDQPTLIDVREPDEYAAGHAPGAINLPLSELTDRVGEVPRDTEVHVICQAGGRSAQATELLSAHGIDAVNIDGGTNAWIQQGHPLESGRA